LADKLREYMDTQTSDHNILSFQNIRDMDRDAWMHFQTLQQNVLNNVVAINETDLPETTREIFYDFRKDKI
jgi:hypothetical protein